MGSRDHFWGSGNFLQICTLGYILKKMSLGVPRISCSNWRKWPFLVFFGLIFGPFWVWNPKWPDHHEILFASVSLLSDPGYLTKICFFAFLGGNFWSFLGHFWPILGVKSKMVRSPWNFICKYFTPIQPRISY